MTIPFVDTFDGAGSQTNLDAWTPTGGTAWTLFSGVASAVRVETGGYVTARSVTLTVYTCDDQGTDDQYTQSRLGTLAAVSIGYACVRLVDQDNFIGWRISGTGATGCELRKKVGGTYTTLITRQGVTNEWLRAEVDGPDNNASVRWYEGGTGASPGTWNQIGSTQSVTDAVFNGATPQGFFTGSSSANVLSQYFEAGPLSGGPSTRTDTVTFSESSTGVPDQPGNRTDTVTFNESSTGVPDQQGTRTDTITFSESSTGIATNDSLVNDTVTFTATQTGVPDQPGNRTDTITFSESSTGAPDGTNVTRTDQVTFNESSVSSWGVYPASRTDTITFSATQTGVNPAQLPVGHLGGDDAPPPSPPRRIRLLVAEREDRMIMELVLVMHLKGLFDESILR